MINPKTGLRIKILHDMALCEVPPNIRGIETGYGQNLSLASLLCCQSNRQSAMIFLQFEASEVINYS